MQFDQLGRREFITLLGGAVAAWPFDAWGQKEQKIPRMGFLGLGPASSFTDRIDALWGGLHPLGYVEGKNLIIEYQWADTVDQLPQLATLLVRMNVDLIFAPVSTFVEPARQATKTIPIVFASHADPIGLGHVQSLALSEWGSASIQCRLSRIKEGHERLAAQSPSALDGDLSFRLYIFDHGRNLCRDNGPCRRRAGALI
jgi:ABC transporter substrate binding protein